MNLENEDAILKRTKDRRKKPCTRQCLNPRTLNYKVWTSPLCTTIAKQKLALADMSGVCKGLNMTIQAVDC